MMLNKFKDSKVLITGHTGFKGSWLVSWLNKLGAKVLGFSNEIPTDPSHFQVAHLASRILNPDFFGDVRDVDVLTRLISSEKPDFIFHLAAQPLVRRSYRDPYFNFSTNVMGTCSVLEAIRLSDISCTAIMITSDKAYDNVEQIWGYREVDRLGGKDPYSASKGAAELIIKGYFNSFFSNSDSRVRLAVGRAGNVIGGGDWAEDRIIPDAIRAWSSGYPVNIRYPKSTRPWQHVLEPLGGYLHLALRLNENSHLNGDQFNFGPPANQNFSVEDLLNEMNFYWPSPKWRQVPCEQGQSEAALLKLSCDKALHLLDWEPVLNFPQTAKFTAEWYRAFYENTDINMHKYTLDQISEYEQIAADRRLNWVLR